MNNSLFIKKHKIKIEGSVVLPLDQLRKEVIEGYCKEAKKRGYCKMNFVFGDETTIKFSVNIDD